MPTVASIVAEIAADVTQYTAGLRQAELDTKRFAGELSRALSGVKLVNEQALAANAQKIARGVTANLRADFARETVSLREQLAREVISETEFQAAGTRAARALNRGILSRMDELRAAGKLTEPLRTALVAQLVQAGAEGGEALRSGVTGALIRLQGDFNQVGRGFQDVGRRLTTGVSLPIAGLAVLGVKVAADAGEAASKMEATFGAATAGMNAQLQQLKRTVPETTATLQDATGDTFNLIRGFGAAVDPARRFSAQVVKLAADVASFRNMRFDDALRAVTAGISGEAEPVRKFGADIREAALNAEGMRLGLIKQGQTLSAVGRAQAAFNIIQRAAGPAIGDAARTATSAQNSFRFLRRDLTDAAQAFGDTLLPVILPVVQQLTVMARAVAGLSPTTLRWAAGILAVGAALGPVLVALGTFARLLGTVGAVLRLLADANGIASLVGSLAALGTTLAAGAVVITGLVLLYTWLTRNREAQQQLAQATANYQAQLAGATNQQLINNTVALQENNDKLQAELERTQNLVNPKHLPTGVLRFVDPQAADQIQEVNNRLDKSRLALKLTTDQWTQNQRAAADAAKVQRDVAQAIADATNGAAASTGKQKTALQQMAERLKDQVNFAQQLNASWGLSSDRIRTILALWDEVTAAVARIPDATAAGASELANVLNDLAKDPIVQFFRGEQPFTPKIDLTPMDQSFIDSAERAKAIFDRVKITPDFDPNAILPGIEGALTRATTASIQAGLDKAFLGLRTVDVPFTLEASGISGGITRLALQVGQASDRVRRFANDMGVWAPLATVARGVADGLNALSRVLGTVASDFSSPLQTVKTVLRGFGDAVLLTVRGLREAATGVARTIIAALNPLNVFRAFGERIGQALEPALNALEGPLSALARVVADGLTPVFLALQPAVDALVPVIRELFNALGPVLVALAPLFKIVAQVLQILVPIIRGAAIAFTYLGQIVLTVGAGLLRLAGNLIIGFGKVIEVIARAIDKLPGVSAKGAINFAKNIQEMGRGMLGVADTMRESSKALGEARTQIRSGNYMDLANGSAAAADGLSDVADAAQDVSEQLRNVPDGVRIALLRFRATAPIIVNNPPSFGGGTVGPNAPRPGGLGAILAGGQIGGTTIQIGTLTIPVDSERTATQVVDTLIRSAQGLATARTGRSTDWTQMLPVATRAALRRVG